MANVKIDLLFPTPLYVTKLETVTESQVEYIKNIPHAQNITELFSTSSASSYVLDEEPLLDIKSEIQNHLNFYLERVMSPIGDVKLNITQSWVNKTVSGASQVPHVHRNSIVSGVFYINDAPFSPIGFERNDTHSFMYDMNQTDFNSEVHTQHCEKFSLLLFPSNIRHFVYPNNTPHSRYSVAFNSFYSGVVGNKEDNTYLEFK